MPRVRLLPLFLLLWLVAPSRLRAQPEAPAAANKRLFDRTVDELNFRTMETVYDKSFARSKFPVALRTHQARKAFDSFAGNADLKRLFLNYNDVSEKFKGRFGKGRTDLAEFDKQLNSLLIDKNFEFFVRVLPRDERVALIRALQRVIKQATAQFNASQDPAPDETAVDAAAVPPADVDAGMPLTTLSDEQAAQPEEAAATQSGPHLRRAEVAARHDWLDYVTLLLAGTSTLLLTYLLLSALPDLRARLDGLAEELDKQQPGTPARRKPAPGTLTEDRYEEDI